MSTTGIAVFVGRWQPPDRQQLAQIRQAIDTAHQVVIVISAAHQARTPRQPFTWQERAAMIEQALGPAAFARVRLIPLRDVHDDARFAQAVHEQAQAVAGELGLPRDATVNTVDLSSDDTGACVRDTLFGADAQSLDSALDSLADTLEPSTQAFLTNWCQQPWRAALAQEWRMLRAYRQAWDKAPYPPVFVTVDAVVRCANRILLIRRGQAPGLGLLALPGGFIELRETAWRSALRELQEETRWPLSDDEMRGAQRGSAVFDHPDRSQRGRTITHAFYFDLGDRPLPEVHADDDAQAAQWVEITQLPRLEDQFHDDHFHILDHFLQLTTPDGSTDTSA